MAEMEVRVRPARGRERQRQQQRQAGQRVGRGEQKCAFSDGRCHVVGAVRCCAVLGVVATTGVEGPRRVMAAN